MGYAVYGIVNGQLTRLSPIYQREEDAQRHKIKVMVADEHIGQLPKLQVKGECNG